MTSPMFDEDEEGGETAATETAAAIIRDLAQEAQKAELLDIGDPRKRHYRIGKEPFQWDVPPPIRKHKIDVPDDFAALVNSHHTPASVWIGMDKITALLDDNDQRDTATMTLMLSEILGTLAAQMKTHARLDQRAFIHLLRYELGYQNIAVINQFRKLDWGNGDKTTSTIQHANMHLGKSITAEVAGVVKLPEEIVLEVPVYSNPGEDAKYQVRCGIEIDTVNHTFQLIPLQDELIRVINLAKASIRNRLDTMFTGKGIIVQYGEA